MKIYQPQMIKHLDVNEIHFSEMISKGKKSEIYVISKKELAKVFNPIVLATMGKDRLLAKKVEKAPRYTSIKELNTPTAMITKFNRCIGYTMPWESCNTLFDTLETTEKLCDIDYITELFLQVNRTVQGLNQNGIIVPDLLTLSNIMISPDGQVKIIDYDGLQLGDCVSYDMSIALGNSLQYITPKYCNPRTGLYTENLDLKSLALLYFRMTFGVDIEMIVRNNPGKDIHAIMDEIFRYLGIEGNDLKEKLAAIYDDSSKNYSIEEEVREIQSNYSLVPIQNYRYPRLAKRK